MQEITEIAPKSESKNPKTFEEAYPIIEDLLSRNKIKWQLWVVPSMDWDDVSQIIKIHIFNKWHMYDQKQNFSPWANTIINNQLKNIRRNVYDFCSRPCLKCAYNTGADSCEWTKDKRQNSSCPLYKRWENGKKYAHDIKLPVSTESHVNEVMELPSHNFDSERWVNIFHSEMKKRLASHLWSVYNLVYIQHLPELEVCKKLGFSGNGKTDKSAYAKIQQIKRKIIKIARELKDKIDLY